MTALLMLLGVLIAATAIGRRVLSLFRTIPDSRLERLTYSTAIGLGVIAYLVLALGLLRQLRWIPVLVGIVALVLLCWNGLLETLLDLCPRSRPDDEPRRARPWLSVVIGATFAAIGVIVLIDCFVPPSGHEWDALAYHLAAPKVYIENHRILFLPTDHHSNFPFLVEMLFTIGLLFDGYALANLFHFTLGALTVAGLIAIGRRHFGRSAGAIAGLSFASTPIVVWEAGAGYVELGMALYVLLAVGAALEFRANSDARSLALAGALMGFALSVKALALAPFVLLAAILLLSRRGPRNLGWYMAAAIVVGCPFYIKSAVDTGNPVYPFAYRVFGGRYWDQHLADAYSSTQGGFGLQRERITAAQDLKNVRPEAVSPTLWTRVRNTVLGPFALISVPHIYYDWADPGVFTHAGFLFLALPPLALLFKPFPSPLPSFMERGLGDVGLWVGALAGLWFLVWVQTMQYVRYLIPLLPLLALIGGAGVHRLVQQKLAMRWLVAGAVALQVFLVLDWFGSRLFVPEGNRPSLWQAATNAEARETYLQRTNNIYASEEWINQNTPRSAGVVLFEEDRGFYLDRPYLWGNEEHSLYIPYRNWSSGQELAEWFLRHGYHYAIVNLTYSQLGNSPEGQTQIAEAIQAGQTDSLFRRWYPATGSDEKFRRLLGQAAADGRAVPIPEASQKGVVVLEFLPK